MSMKIWFKVFCLPLWVGITVTLASPSAWSMMWGSGMWGGSQACGYEMRQSEEATSLKEELDEMNKELREYKADMRKAKSKLSSLKKILSGRKDIFKQTGFEGAAFSTIDNHITIGSKCSDYQPVTCEQVTFNFSPLNRTDRAPANDDPVPPPPGVVTDGSDSFIDLNSRPRRGGRGRNTQPVTPATGAPTNPASAAPSSGAPSVAPPAAGGGVVVTPTLPACSDNLIDPSPFSPEVWKRNCGPADGELKDSICDQNIDRPKTYRADLCKRYLKEWIDKQKELLETEAEIADLDIKIKALELNVKINRLELREANKEHQREMREAMTEGTCDDCLITAGSVYAPKKASGWEVAANVALGLGSMYLGNNLNKYAMDNNAKLGFPTQPYPAFGYGFPYFMGALYGAIGGSSGGGAFGCFGGNMGPAGGMGPFGMGGVYGPQGGAFGYPQGMWGPMMSGGAFLPGMGGFGMPGPWGSAMCMTWPCPAGGMGMQTGMMAGGNIGIMMPGIGYPQGMMASGGMMMPGMMGGMMAPGMMTPGMMASGGMMMPGMMGGMMAPGMMAPGMMASGGMMMPGMMGGMMAPGMMTPGMMASGGMMMPGMMGGMMAPGMMAPGMMASGGMMMPGMMGGMMAPGMMASGMMGGLMASGGMMMPGMMGGMDGGMGAMQMQMQMQQQMMQMQMQAYQQQMQMQQQKYQQYMAQQQVVSGLTQEMYTLMYRLQQAQMGMYSGGYISTPVTPTYPGSGGGPLYPGTPPYNPVGNPGIPTGAPRTR